MTPAERVEYALEALNECSRKVARERADRWARVRGPLPEEPTPTDVIMLASHYLPWGRAIQRYPS